MQWSADCSGDFGRALVEYHGGIHGGIDIIIIITVIIRIITIIIIINIIIIIIIIIFLRHLQMVPWKITPLTGTRS